MGKLSKKLIVYLDQNFISEMAKADENERVKREFPRIYELLHRGFMDEKVVVPCSHYHDSETCLVPRLRERIREYQGYLGQVKLQDRSYVQVHELKNAIERFKGTTLTDFGARLIFKDDPDKRIQRFNIRGNIRWDAFYSQSSRRANAERLSLLREQLHQDGISSSAYEDMELAAQERRIVSERADLLNAGLGADPDTVAAFVASGAIRNMPSVSLFAKMWTKLAVDYYTRPIQAGDGTDIDAISSYLPYVDLFATDSFMANLVRNLHFDTEYDTPTFGAGNKDLAALEERLSILMPDLESVNKPTLALFVLSDEGIKNDSWEFFRGLGNLAKAHEGNEGGWVELFAFDDGNMPQHYNDTIDHAWPFYGMQDVSTIRLPGRVTSEDVISLCREHSRAPAFVLIDRYEQIPGHFVSTALERFRRGDGEVLGYRIVKT